jgi:eukaryotic-like serine/threonine-protein kinase
MVYSLAQLGLARSAVLSADTMKARKAYEDFFTLWRNADSDLTLLREAKQEYQRLAR